MTKPVSAAARCVGLFVHAGMHRREARPLMLEAGWRYLGGGSFGAVFLNLAGDRVVRIGKPDLGYAAQVKAAQAHPYCEHLPRIYGHTELACGGMATEMEVLESCGYDSDSSGDAAYEQARHAYSTMADRCDDVAKATLYGALDILKSYMGDGTDDRPADWDFHRGNVMHRNGVPVMTDVLFDERNWAMIREQAPEGVHGTPHSHAAVSEVVEARRKPSTAQNRADDALLAELQA